MFTLQKRIKENIKLLKTLHGYDKAILYEKLYYDFRLLIEKIIWKYYPSFLFDEVTLDSVLHTSTTEIIMNLEKGKGFGIKNWVVYLRYFIRAYVVTDSVYGKIYQQEPNLVERVSIEDVSYLRCDVHYEPDYNLIRKEKIIALVRGLFSFISSRLPSCDRNLHGVSLVLILSSLFEKRTFSSIPYIGNALNTTKVIFEDDMKYIRIMRNL